MSSIDYKKLEEHDWHQQESRRYFRLVAAIQEANLILYAYGGIDILHYWDMPEAETKGAASSNKILRTIIDSDSRFQKLKKAMQDDTHSDSELKELIRELLRL